MPARVTTDLPTISADGLLFRDLDHDGVLAPYEDWRLPADVRAATEDGFAASALARSGQTLVFYMGITGLNIISSQLIAHGLAADTPAALIYKATLPEERFIPTTLQNLETTAIAEAVRPPALIVVGSVLTLAGKTA